MKLDPRRLLDFLAVARHGSFSAAAEATRSSQPGLSQSIALLERALGTRILDRGRHGAHLTENGKAIAFHARALESLLDRATEEMRLRTLGVEGPLAIGITPITAVGLVPEALNLLLSETPNIAVSITEGLDDKIISMLRSRELDLVVCRLGQGALNKDIEEEALMLSNWALITQPKHPLAAKPTASLTDLGDVQWVLPAEGSSFRRQLEFVFASAGVDWPVQGISTNSIMAIKAIVMTTNSVTIMWPGLIDVESAAGRLRATPLADIGSLKPVGLMWRRNDDLSPIAARFAKILRLVASASIKEYPVPSTTGDLGKSPKPAAEHRSNRNS